MSTLIFEHSQRGRACTGQIPTTTNTEFDIPEQFKRKSTPALPEVSELQVVRHYTKLSQKNFSVDTNFYPLGSCTMKYNPRCAHKLAQLPAFSMRHPFKLVAQSQGFLQCMYDLQEMLKDITGMDVVSLTPMAGSQGELTGVVMIRAYHDARGDKERTEFLIPDAAHGTNPASAIMGGYKVREIPTDAEGDLNVDALRAAVGPKTAGIMLTNPSTLGVFERRIEEIARIVHEAGGLLYYDGANLNAIMGKVRPGDMGFDVIHLNLHKTFATPHGGGGPGAGPVAANERLAPYLPIPMVTCDKENKEVTYRWLTEKDCSQTIGRLSAFMGNAGILLRAYIYIRRLGREGLERVTEYATLNANYLMIRLQEVGFNVAFPTRRATHEFIVTLKEEAKVHGATAKNVAKRLLDYDVHAPTTYFPLLIPECLLIEPTETETKETLDDFVEVMKRIREEMQNTPEKLKEAPWTQPVRRVDEVKAARELDVKKIL